VLLKISPRQKEGTFDEVGRNEGIFLLVIPTNKVFFDQRNKKKQGNNSKDSSGHFKTLSPRAMTDLGGERFEGMPCAGCLR
jgi:hypothetical protein